MLRKLILTGVLALTLVIGGVWLYRGDWLAMQIVGQSHPRFVEEPSESHPTRGIAVFVGTQVDGETQTRQLRKHWSPFGHVTVAVFSQEIFDRKTIIEDTFEKLRKEGFHELCLIGSSGGGQMVVDFMRYNRAHGNYFSISGVIIEDAPMDQTDLVDTRAGLMKKWRPGITQNAGSSLFWGMNWNPPAPAADADLALLAEHHAISKSYRLSGWGDQVRAILRFRPVDHGEFAGVPFIYLLAVPHEDATNDGVVKHASAPKWVAGFGETGDRIVRVRSPHAEWVAFPTVWREAFSSALTRLYPHG